MAMHVPYGIFIIYSFIIVTCTNKCPVHTDLYVTLSHNIYICVVYAIEYNKIYLTGNIKFYEDRHYIK